jgi:hypothetical protein
MHGCENDPNEFEWWIAATKVVDGDIETDMEGTVSQARRWILAVADATVAILWLLKMNDIHIIPMSKWINFLLQQP